MPTHTIETTYRVPNYRQQTHTAETVDEACRLAIEDDDWDQGITDYENAGETYVTGIWKGENCAYSGPAVDIPEAFDETVHRNVELCEELIELLREPAQRMGLSKADFEHWLPRARAALAKADAICIDAAARP